MPRRRGGSSVGRASRSQCEGRGFDPLPLHQNFSRKPVRPAFFVFAPLTQLGKSGEFMRASLASARTLRQGEKHGFERVHGEVRPGSQAQQDCAARWAGPAGIPRMVYSTDIMMNTGPGSSVWIEHPPPKGKVGGSTPPRGAIFRGEATPAALMRNHQYCNRRHESMAEPGGAKKTLETGNDFQRRETGDLAVVLGAS